MRDLKIMVNVTTIALIWRTELPFCSWPKRKSTLWRLWRAYVVQRTLISSWFSRRLAWLEPSSTLWLSCNGQPLKSLHFPAGLFGVCIIEEFGGELYTEFEAFSPWLSPSQIPFFFFQLLWSLEFCLLILHTSKSAGFYSNFSHVVWHWQPHFKLKANTWISNAWETKIWE